MRGGILTAKPTPSNWLNRRPRHRLVRGGAGARAGGAPAAGGGGGGQALAVGEDSVDWVKVFEAAKIGGLKHYFVEQAFDVTTRERGVPEDLERP